MPLFGFKKRKELDSPDPQPKKPVNWGISSPPQPLSQPEISPHSPTMAQRYQRIDQEIRKKNQDNRWNLTRTDWGPAQNRCPPISPIQLEQECQRISKSLDGAGFTPEEIESLALERLKSRQLI